MNIVSMKIKSILFFWLLLGGAVNNLYAGYMPTGTKPARTWALTITNSKTTPITIAWGAHKSVNGLQGISGFVASPLDYNAPDFNNTNQKQTIAAGVTVTVQIKSDYQRGYLFMNPQSYQKNNYIWDIEVTDDKGEKRRIRNITDVPSMKTLGDKVTNINTTMTITETTPYYSIRRT